MATMGLATLLGAPALLSVSGHFVASATQAETHEHGPMSDAEMQRWIADWFSKHPEVGRGSATAAVADTFFALSSLKFNSDGNTATQVDTAKILVGDAILIRWSSGSHTATSGTGPTDPQVGSMFDVAISSSQPNFITPPYNNTGTFHFFCRLHFGSNMRGVVVVRSVVGVGPSDGVSLGFIAGPAPNPSQGVVHFRFALREDGPVRAEILDVRGRRIATVLNQRFDAGSYAAAWNGQDDRGASAPAGVYYLRLRVPGSSDTRRFVVR